MGHRPKKPIERRGESGLSAEELEHLIHGQNLLDGDDPTWADDDEARRQVWEKHKTFIMSLQGQPCKGESFRFQRGNTYFEYGTRPEAWWSYDAPGPRLLLKGDPGNAVEGCGLSMGTPRRFRDGQAMVFESERDYLERHGLLNDRETAMVQDRK